MWHGATGRWRGHQPGSLLSPPLSPSPFPFFSQSLSFLLPLPFLLPVPPSPGRPEGSKPWHGGYSPSAWTKSGPTQYSCWQHALCQGFIHSPSQPSSQGGKKVQLDPSTDEKTEAQGVRGICSRLHAVKAGTPVSPAAPARPVFFLQPEGVGMATQNQPGCVSIPSFCQIHDL